MRGNIKSFQILGRIVHFYLPPDITSFSRVVFLFSGNELFTKAEALISPIERNCLRKQCIPFPIISLEPLSWEADYTPWKIKETLPHSNAFTGDASKTVSFLKDTLIPFVEETLSISQETTDFYCVGYSLGGLFALWLALEDSLFKRVASCSSSVWYPSFMDFYSHKIESLPLSLEEAYFSLGKKEESPKQVLMSSIGENTKALYSSLSSHLGEKRTKFVWHEGGHFTEIPHRLANAMVWLNRH